ncbi:Cytochrome bd-II oxidase subunit 2 [Raoultella planticola]|uniref:Cytochrome bd-II oxidase subunit 2 n=1 Tax=Raoultella planticola TaxID=575 RepID=A0A485AGC3_RAOPL|nr:Cytochrome bd-II oxidase subunit 2 [Raoultella planticola]
MGIDLSVIWFVIIVFATLMYIVMDGFDLGIGILFSTTRDAEDRDVMVNSVAPVWDGNETWLVLGGAGLFGAFPLAYAVIIDALAIPLTLMLIGLIFRGVAFEFRFQATPSHRPFWDRAFLGGSLLATFSQGVVVGAVINGFSVSGRAFSGGMLDWLTPFTLFCGLGLTIAYALLGATLAGHEERKSAAGQNAPYLADAAAGAADRNRRHQPVDAAGAAGHRRPLVHSAEPLFPAAGSPAGCGVRGLAVADLRNPHRHALPFILTLGLVFLRLQRSGDQYLATHYSAGHYAVAGRRAAAEPGFHAGRRPADYSGDPRLYLLELLRVSRQSPTW